MPNNDRYYSLRRPCADCPFRADGQGVALRPERARSLLESAFQDAPFVCHKTLDPSASEEDEDTRQANAVHCAGMTILLEKAGRPSLSMRLGEYLGLFDPSLTRPHWDEVIDPEDLIPERATPRSDVLSLHFMAHHITRP